MRYLNEEPSGDDPFMKVRDQQLVDLGYKWNPLGTNAAAQKKSPHYKYYWIKLIRGFYRIYSIKSINN